MSHVSALVQWTVRTTTCAEPVHVIVPASRSLRAQPGLHLHRASAVPPSVRVDGLPTACLPSALIASWPLLAPRNRREPVITAVRRRLVRPAELALTLSTTRRLAGREELQELVRLLDEGCESELEIWGHLKVFDTPGLRHGRRQLWVRTPSGTFRVDVGYEAERVAVELDGARFHSSREQRERDMCRDAAFASIDWVTLRFSHGRLHDDIGGCQRDTLATLAARRRRNEATG